MKKFVDKRKLAAAVDYPMAYFYKDLLAAFPEAKVILSVRSPESWYHSVKNTIYTGTIKTRVFPQKLFSYLIGMDDKYKVWNLDSFLNDRNYHDFPQYSIF